MNFLNTFGESGVERPCSQLMSYPLQCFQELFLATPAVVGTFVAEVGGFAAAVIIWGAIFAVTLYSFLFALKYVFRATKYFFQDTRVGQKIVTLIPFKGYMRRICCRAQEVAVQQPRKLINAQALGEYGANIVSKVHVDSKWFRNAFRSIPFASKNDEDANHKGSPTKTPQRSTSRISALTPKLLSPRSHKQ